MSELRPLLVALSDATPCGNDLEYDPQFLELEQAGNGKAEQQYGDTVIPAKPPDWPAVLELAGALARRTRDVRVAVWLLRASARVRGWAGAVMGLQLLDGLLSQHWAQVHPQLDASDGNSPLLRLSALSPLTPQESPYPGPPHVLNDLRETRLLASDRSSPLVRDIELGLRAAEPLAGELVPTQDGIVGAVAALLARHSELASQMQAGLEAIDGIVATLAAHLPAADMPDLAQMRKLLAAVARAAQLALGNAAPLDDAGANATAAPGLLMPAAVPGTINSREDVSRTIDRLCDWLEHNEPSHPAPLLLRRAQRLMNKSFLEIIRDMAPDGTDQVVRLAGRPDNE
jgi:type VI secretion system protein ImpA